MDRKNDLLQTWFLYFRKVFVTVLIFIFLVAGSGWISGCGTEADTNDEPEFPDADFVWRVCNEHEEFEMENVRAFATDSIGQRDYITVGSVPPSDCSSYKEGPINGTHPIYWLIYDQAGQERTIAYLEVYPITRGLVDSTTIVVREIPGRYSYHCNYEDDVERRNPILVEIEREAFH